MRLSSKLHLVANACGRLVRVALTAGQRHDAPQALPMLVGLAPAHLVADRGCDAAPLVATLTARGTCGPTTRPTTPSALPSSGSSAASSSFTGWQYGMEGSMRIFWPLFM